jgi:hypothetical protein
VVEFRHKSIFVVRQMNWALLKEVKQHEIDGADGFCCFGGTALITV